MTFALGTVREPQSGQSRLNTRFIDRFAEWRKWDGTWAGMR